MAVGIGSSKRHKQPGGHLLAVEPYWLTEQGNAELGFKNALFCPCMGHCNVFSENNVGTKFFYIFDDLLFVARFHIAAAFQRKNCCPDRIVPICGFFADLNILSFEMFHPKIPPF